MAAAEVPPAPPRRRLAAAGAWRALALLALWVVMAGGAAPADLAVGVAAAALAAWASLRLAPPADGPRRARPPAVALLLLRLPWQAARAGIEVALLALDPRRAPRPGLVPFAPRLPPGAARDGFLALSGLRPGALPVGEDAGGRVALHALDLASAPAAAEAMAREEARFARAAGLPLRG